MLRGPEKKFLNNDLFLKNALIWREKKNHENPVMRKLKTYKISRLENNTQPASQQVVTQENEQS